MSATSDVNGAEADAIDTTLSSSVSTSPADALLSQAITTALCADPSIRGELFARLLADIASCMQDVPLERPWTFEALSGTDGSRIFRGQTGRSIVVDPLGMLWKARSYEDFHIEYVIEHWTCSIASITPNYEFMQPYSLADAATAVPHS
jgi:hypothetical protein